MREACVAVIPAFNERERITPVLRALSQCPDVEEVIVVDDGSRETLDGVVSPFPKTRLLRLPENVGKAQAMERGVSESNASYILFCDADLVGFTAEHASALIRPVVSGKYRMSVGLRGNLAQRAVYWFAVNSGERCLPREDWVSLPAFYKHGFRIEAGLNMRAWLRGDRVLHLSFPYANTLRERKYGLWRGFHSRIVLCADVALAWAHALFTQPR